MGITRDVGTPLKIDSNSVNRMFGHFARVLLEVDLSNTLPETMMIEHQGFCSFVSLSYERVPNFCSHCTIVGHSISNCK